MKLNKFLTIIIIFSFFISGCTSVKETLSGQKKQNSDEFLVKKKNPLVLPPNFNELPEPGKSRISETNNQDSFEGKILNTNTENKNQKENTTVNSTEELILKNIKNNDSN